MNLVKVFCSLRYRNAAIAGYRAEVDLANDLAAQLQGLLAVAITAHGGEVRTHGQHYSFDVVRDDNTGTPIGTVRLT